uniref:Ubiquitin carboxyl-terminal hydrolase 64E-like n=1 Tax=Callorhinchus milii TaxID=7868 RepID=A0A4W3JMC0_CALMI
MGEGGAGKTVVYAVSGAIKRMWMKIKDRNSFKIQTPVGLINQGATCYLNTLLQILYMTPEFKNTICNLETDNQIICQLKIMFEKLQKSKKAVETHKLTTSLQLDVLRQQDIADFFLFLMHEVNTYMDQDQTILKFYQITIGHEMKCQECNANYKKEYPWLTIPLPICSSSNKFKHLEIALDEFLKWDILNGDNQCYCDICKEVTDTSSRYHIKELPQILTVQLLRFHFDTTNRCYQKFDDCIEIPLTLMFEESRDNPNEWCLSSRINKESPDESFSTLLGTVQHPHQESKVEAAAKEKLKSTKEFELFAACYHEGVYGYGHYHADIKSTADVWYSFNDQTVAKLSNVHPNRFNKSYLIMYRRKNANKSGYS